MGKTSRPTLFHYLTFWAFKQVGNLMWYCVLLLQDPASMSGRNRTSRDSRYPDDFGNVRNVPRPVINRGPGPIPIHAASLENELELQRYDMEKIFAKNRHILDDNTLLKRELVAAKDEIHRMGQVIPKLQAENEGQIRELMDKGRKLDSELRAAEPLRAEVMQLRAEVQKLNALRQEISGQVQGLTQDVSRLRAENEQIVNMKGSIDGMRKELAEARRVFEHEKKANEEHVALMQTMDQKLVNSARELEKLRAEKVNAARRAVQPFSSGVYGALNGSPEARYLGSGSGYGDSYGGAWGAYDPRGPLRR